MRAVINTTFPINKNDAWEILSQSRTLRYICKGLLSFRSEEPFPNHWQSGQQVNARLLLFSLVPAWRHTIEFKTVSREEGLLITQEHGGLVRTWNHTISLKERDDSSCTYTDIVDIEAGVLTPFIWSYAQILYRYRQRRWRVLIKGMSK